MVDAIGKEITIPRDWIPRVRLEDAREKKESVRVADVWAHAVS